MMNSVNTSFLNEAPYNYSYINNDYLINNYSGNNFLMAQQSIFHTRIFY